MLAAYIYIKLHFWPICIFSFIFCMDVSNFAYWSIWIAYDCIFLHVPAWSNDSNPSGSLLFHSGSNPANPNGPTVTDSCIASPTIWLPALPGQPAVSPGPRAGPAGSYASAEFLIPVGTPSTCALCYHIAATTLWKIGRGESLESCWLMCACVSHHGMSMRSTVMHQCCIWECWLHMLHMSTWTVLLLSKNTCCVSTVCMSEWVWMLHLVYIDSQDCIHTETCTPCIWQRVRC